MDHGSCSFGPGFVWFAERTRKLEGQYSVEDVYIHIDSVGEKGAFTLCGAELWGILPLDQKCSMDSILSLYGHLLLRHIRFRCTDTVVPAIPD